MVLPDFGAERYRRLQPYITALPVGTKLNVCTAPGIVLDSLSETQRAVQPQPGRTSRNGARTRASRRSRTCAARSGQAAYDQIKDSLSESSSYFRATVWVTIGTTQFTLYSLLARGGSRNGATGPAQFRSRMTV